MKRKIVFLEAVQDYGGARISTVELAERLKQKYDVTIVDYYGSCQPFLDDVNSRDINIRILEKQEKPNIINLSRSPIVKILNYFKALPHVFKMRKKVIEALTQIKPDYVIINNFKVLLGLINFPQKQFDIYFFARGWFLPSQISRIEKFMMKRFVDKYLCVSQATKDALFCGNITNSLENLYVVHNAINESKISKDKVEITKGEDTTIILHAGGFLEDKGQLVSIKVAERLKRKGLNCKMILAGLLYKDATSQKFYERIVNDIEEMGLADIVEIVVGKHNVISYFNACDILIHPSATEGLPRVVMEAMVLKKPVIANAVGGVTDYILHEFTGFLPHYNSADEYADYIEMLIKTPDLHKQITTNAYNLVKDTYTEEKQLESLYRAFNS